MNKQIRYHQSGIILNNNLPLWKYIVDDEKSKRIYSERNYLSKEIIFYT